MALDAHARYAIGRLRHPGAEEFARGLHGPVALLGNEPRSELEVSLWALHLWPVRETQDYATATGYYLAGIARRLLEESLRARVHRDRDAGAGPLLRQARGQHATALRRRGVEILEHSLDRGFRNLTVRDQ